ncbi:MAG: quinoprotein dehydrogenase-associated putative ABC transporter substrate-binding protein [Bryobacterales bacterium]|nr:quinoprotein dehydrogenase-associated putative ABC transporter substrate-binding protein [Bryobacterales bacterium]
MCSRFLSLALIAGALSGAEHTRTLRLCAEPHNMPLSNERLEGFENKIGAIVAADLKADVEWVFWAQRRGYIRNTITEGRCDVLMGVPQDLERVLTTTPYYRSAYAIVSARKPAIVSLEDPALKGLRIGIHLSGEGYTPPAQVLAARGLKANVSGYMLFGAMDDDEPAAKPIRALERGELDVAVVWGPFAGYFARRDPRLIVTPVAGSVTAPDVPFSFAISMGVNPSDAALRDELSAAIKRHAREIDLLLASYGVPLVAP